MQSSFFKLGAATAAAMTLAACAGQADKSYRGEPLAQLRGRVEAAETPPAEPLPPLSAALIWKQTAPNSDAKIAIARPRLGTSVAVSGSFPAEFTLDLYEPPTDGALFTCFPDHPQTPGRMGIAKVRAIRQDASPSSGSPFDFYGEVRDFIVVYVDADLPAVSACPGGALAKGFHLFGTIDVPSPPCADRPVDDPSCQGPWPYAEVPMSTPLTLLIVALSRNVPLPPGPSSPPGSK